MIDQYNHNIDTYTLAKRLLSIGIGAAIASGLSACTGPFGALGGPEIQRVYNERMKIVSQAPIDEYAAPERAELARMIRGAK